MSEERTWSLAHHIRDNWLGELSLWANLFRKEIAEILNFQNGVLVSTTPVIPALKELRCLDNSKNYALMLCSCQALILSAARKSPNAAQQELDQSATTTLALTAQFVYGALLEAAFIEGNEGRLFEPTWPEDDFNCPIELPVTPAEVKKASLLVFQLCGSEIEAIVESSTSVVH